MRRAYFPLSRGLEQCVPGGTRSVNLKDRRGSALLLQAAGDFTGRCREYDRQRLLQTGVSRVANGVRCRGAETLGCEPRRKRRLVDLKKAWIKFLWVQKSTLTTTQRQGFCRRCGRRCSRT